MNYYSINYSSGQETGSIHPQTNCTTQVWAHQLSAWQFPDFEPKLHFDLEYHAKLTDALSDASINASGFLINQKIKDIFDRFHLMNHQYHNAKVKLPRNKEVLPYYFLQVSDLELTKQLDYQKSKFIETKWTLDDVGPIQIDSLAQYMRQKEKDEEGSFAVDVREIYVNHQFNKELDLFTFLPFETEIIISERLYSALIKSKISGFEFSLLKHLYIQ